MYGKSSRAPEHGTHALDNYYLRVHVAKIEEGVGGERGPQGGQQDIGGQEAEVEEPAAVEEVERLRGGLGPKAAVDEGNGAYNLFWVFVCKLGSKIRWARNAPRLPIHRTTRLQPTLSTLPMMEKAWQLRTVWRTLPPTAEAHSEMGSVLV